MNRKTAIQMQIRAAMGLAVAATVVSAALGPGVAGDAEQPAWPLEGRPAVSSNFCEYREGHFHAGLDIRTYGAEGVPCLAAGDGYVSRMRASPAGYGKALYVRLDSGETAVYAHLAEFDTTLELELYEAQRRAGGYTVDVRFPRGRFPVRRGDVIAWSGSTGGIDPHLHFEVRDIGENPLNPFLYGFKLEDILSPEFERVEFTPLGPDARVNGHCWPAQFTSERVGAGRFVVTDTLVLSGNVGLAAEVFDRLNAQSGRLAPYRVTLAVDDTVVADIRMERFSFSHADQVDFLYDVGRVRRERAYFLQLFESGGESMWNRRFLRGGALEGDPAGGPGAGVGVVAVHRGVVDATDAAGNAARLVFYFVDGGARALSSVEWENVPLRLGTAVPGHFFRGSLVSTVDAIAEAQLEGGRALPIDLTATASIDGYRQPNVYTARDLADGPFRSPLRRAGEVENVYLIGVEHGKPTSVNFADLALQLIFGKQTLYSDAVIYATAWQDTGRQTNPGELLARTAPVQIGPYSIRLRADMEVRMTVGTLDSSSAVYRLNERKGEWVFYESAAEGGSVRTTARRPGVYCVFDDRYGPRIRKPFVRTSQSYATGRRRPAVVIPIEDTGSGVNHKMTAVSIDGIEQIAFWESREKKLFVVVRDPNIMGPRSISVVAYDNVGNRSQLDANIDITITPRTREKD